jgi:hypothetical protein
LSSGLSGLNITWILCDAGDETNPVKPRMAFALVVKVFPSEVRVGDLAYLGYAHAKVQKVQRSTDYPGRGLWFRERNVCGEHVYVKGDLRWDVGDAASRFNKDIPRTADQVPLKEAPLADDAFAGGAGACTYAATRRLGDGLWGRVGSGPPCAGCIPVKGKVG